MRLKPDNPILPQSDTPFSSIGQQAKNWLPVIAWAGVIFYFSTEHFSSFNTFKMLADLMWWIFPAAPGEQIESANLLTRKMGHWSEYFVLCLLFWRAYRNGSNKIWQAHWATWSLSWVLLYAVSDEVHQAFVPSRTAAVGDVLLDFFGGVCAVLWIYARKARTQGS
jgi:VanZ family protein